MFFYFLICKKHRHGQCETKNSDIIAILSHYFDDNLKIFPNLWISTLPKYINGEFWLTTMTSYIFYITCCWCLLMVPNEDFLNTISHYCVMYFDYDHPPSFLFWPFYSHHSSFSSLTYIVFGVQCHVECSHLKEQHSFFETL